MSDTNKHKIKMKQTFIWINLIEKAPPINAEQYYGLLKNGKTNLGLAWVRGR